MDGVTHLNLGCGNYRAATPWTNVDVRDDVGADVVITTGQAVEPLSLGIPLGSLERIYFGHAIEHMPWGPSLAHFVGDLCLLLDEGGQIAIVAPDVVSLVESVADGTASVDQFLQAMEDDRHHGLNAGPFGDHRWNCYAERLLRLVNANAADHGVHWELTPVVEGSPLLAPFPVVSYAPHQCAVIGTKS